MSAAEFTTLNELFLQAVAKFSKPDCFLSKRDGRYQGLSSEDALHRVAALASVLARRGVKRGDRVAILAENRVEWALTDYALLGLGAIPVPIYTTLLEPDIEYILRDSGAKGIVLATEAQLQKVVNVHPRLPELNFILAMACAHLEGSGADCWESILVLELGSHVEAVEAFKATAQAVEPHDIATILYTSGTMGEPKGVILTHANLVSNILACRKLFPLDASDANMSFLPLSHVYQRAIDYLCFSVGTTIAYAENLEALPANLSEVRPTIVGVVPRVLEKIHDRVMEVVRSAPAARQKLFRWAVKTGRQALPHRLRGQKLPSGLGWKFALADRLVFSKVRERMGGRIRFLISGSAPLAPDLAEFFHAVGLPVYEGYGLTETSPVIAVNYPGHAKLGTVGPLIEHVDVSLGEASCDPEDGAGREILVRGPNVSPGYYHSPQANREAFADGWFHTGDLGEMDEEGFLRVTGRKKNLFKTSGGKYVCPEKVENLFQGHPDIHQIMVLGAGRKFVGALIVPNFVPLEAHARSQGLSWQSRAALVAHPAIRAHMQQVVEDATHWLAPHERIRQIVLLPQEFTMGAGEISATLKVKRRVVEAKYRDLIEEMFTRHAPQAPGVGDRAQHQPA